MVVKDAQTLGLLRRSGQILSKLHGMLAAEVKPGVTTAALDRLAEAFIRDHGATPSFKGFQGYPASLCTSVNEVVIHGLPSAQPLQQGDIVAIDCGVCYQGYHTDAAYTHAVGAVSDELLCLLAKTQHALHMGIAQATPKHRVGDISHAIEKVVQAAGYGIIREYGGHGIGRRLHESPHIPNFGRPGKGVRLREGQVIAIEPITALGKAALKHRGHWHVATKDGSPSAHFEQTVALIGGKAEVLTPYHHIPNAPLAHG